MKLKFTIHVFFLNRQLFSGNYLTLDYHADTAISHAVAYSSRWLPKPLQGLLYIKSKTYIDTFYLVISCTNFSFKVNFSFLLFFFKITWYIRVSLTYSIFSFSLVSFMVYLVNRLPSTTGWRNSCLFSVTSPHPPTGVSRAKYIFFC